MSDSIGAFEELVLLMVAVLHGEAYAVAIRDELSSRAGRTVHISAVHSCLNRLEKKGFVLSEMGQPTPERGGRRKRMFAITGAGKTTLQDARSVRESAWSQIPSAVWQLKAG